MRKLSLSLIVAFALYATAAVAQSGNMGGSAGSQGTQGSSPSGQSGAQTQPGQPGGPDMGSGTAAPSDQTGSANNNMGDHSQGEKKLKGCIQSQGGQYVLESKHGKSVMLTGQDLAAHVGHEVKVKGTWESGNASGMSSTSSSTTSASGNSAGEKTFNVTNVEMVSDTCKGSSKNSSGSTGMSGSSTTGSSGSTGAGGGSSTGTGSSTGSGSSTGTGSGSGSGSSTTPPQQ